MGWNQDSKRLSVMPVPKRGNSILDLILDTFSVYKLDVEKYLQE